MTSRLGKVTVVDRQDTWFLFCFVFFVSPRNFSRCLQCLCKYNHLNFVHCTCVSDVSERSTLLGLQMNFVIGDRWGQVSGKEDVGGGR